jgi:hypothetical protein
LEKPSARTAASALFAKTPLTPTVTRTHDKTLLPSQAIVTPKSDRAALVSDVRYTSDSASAVVFLDLDQETQFEVHRLSSPERIYLDLQNTKLAPVLFGKEIQTQDHLLRALRVGQHEHQTTRITLATAQICDYSVTRVPNSFRLRIELRQTKAPQADKRSSVNE